MTENEGFVERLKALRKRRGLTQAEFARIIHLDRSYVSQLERGRREIQTWLQERIEVLEKEEIYSARPSITPFHRPPTAHSSEGEEVHDTPPYAAPTPEDCHKHLDLFLEKCKNDLAKVAWTFVELSEHFPLDKWDR